MDVWESYSDVHSDVLANNFLLETFVIYFWPRYSSVQEEDQRRLIKWLLSKNNGRGTAAEQNLKLNLEPALAFLSKCHDDPTYTDESGQTIMHILFSIYIQSEVDPLRDDCQITINLMNAGASIVAVDRNGNTPLGMAVAKNRLDIVQSLPQFIKNVDCYYSHNKFFKTSNSHNSLGETALHIVMKSYIRQEGDNPKERWKYLKIIEDFIWQAGDYNSPDINGITPVHYAAMKCYLATLKTFKDRKANLHAETKIGDNLLILACKNITLVNDPTAPLRTIDWLLDQGYNMNHRNRGGHTALHYAAQSAQVDVIIRLIERGAAVNVVGLDGTTPLHSAVMSSYLKSCRGMTASSRVVDYLLDRGVNVNLEEQVFDGFTIVHLSAFNRDKTIFKRFCRKALNKPGRNGFTPLHLAAMSANTEVVKELIEHGADVHSRDNIYQYTPLHLASMRGQFRYLDDIVPGFEEQLDMNQSSLVRHCFSRLPFRIDVETDYKSVIDLLLRDQADVNAKDSRGYTPLHYASQQSDAKIVEKLLKAGARVDVLDNVGHVPLHNAMLATIDNWRGIECLLKYGADIDDVEETLKDIYVRSKISKFTIADRLLRYVAKLECARLRKADSFYKPSCKKPRIENFKPKYKREIEIMKKRMLMDSVSLYDMLHMTTKQRASFIDSLPSHLEMELGFPDYGTIIYGRCYEAVNRESMLETAMLACNLMTQVQWPELCIEYIFSFLRNRDLRALIDSVPDLSIL